MLWYRVYCKWRPNNDERYRMRFAVYAPVLEPSQCSYLPGYREPIRAAIMFTCSQKNKEAAPKLKGPVTVSSWINDFKSLAELSMPHTSIFDVTPIVNFSLDRVAFTNLTIGQQNHIHLLDWSGLNITTITRPMIQIIESAVNLSAFNLSCNQISISSLGEALTSVQNSLNELDISGNGLAQLSPKFLERRTHKI